MSAPLSVVSSLLTLLLWTGTAMAAPIVADTGTPDGRMAMASRPSSPGKFEIEAADDFVLTQNTELTGGTFFGLLTGRSIAAVGEVRVEIYRVFPLDSNVGRTSGAPTFGTAQVPTRVNSPSDVEFDDRDSAAGNLSFAASLLLPGFTAANSVQPGGIHPLPSQTTGGDGSVTGDEVQFDVTFSTPLVLQAGHYFFVPQIELTDTNGEFYWLSSSRPIVPPGLPFSPDLQAWTRDENLAPDWLRVGTDIVGGIPAPTFNGAFSLNGSSLAVPEPGTLGLLVMGAMAFAATGRRRASRRAE